MVTNVTNSVQTLNAPAMNIGIPAILSSYASDRTIGTNIRCE